MTDQIKLSDLTKASPSDDEVCFALDVTARQAAAPTEAEVERAREIFARIGAQAVQTPARRMLERDSPALHDDDGRGRVSLPDDDSDLLSEEFPFCGKPTKTGTPCRIRRAGGVKPCNTHGTPDEWEVYRQTDHYKREREESARQAEERRREQEERKVYEQTEEGRREAEEYERRRREMQEAQGSGGDWDWLFIPPVESGFERWRASGGLERARRGDETTAPMVDHTGM